MSEKNGSVVTHLKAQQQLEKRLGQKLKQFDFSMGTTDKVVAISAVISSLDTVVFGEIVPHKHALQFKDIRFTEPFFCRFNPKGLGTKIVFWT